MSSESNVLETLLGNDRDCAATVQNANQWTPPSYDITKPPSLLHTISISQNQRSPVNFARWAKWCPDGSTALAQCEDASLQYLDFPPSDLSPALDANQVTRKEKVFRQSAPVLDFAWYPRATCADPASFCFVSSVRECPVKLIDGADGRLRASYRIVDHRERQIAPHSLAFNVTATKLYCGFEDAIEVFDLNYPGPGTRLHTTPSKKSRDGLKGIISSLAFSPDMSSGVYAAGSLSPSAPTSSNIALFTETTGETPVMYVGDESSSSGFGIRAGVSQLMFNPLRPYLMYAAFRREDKIYSWDIRGDAASPVQIFDKSLPASSTHSQDFVETLRRKQTATNQRLRFDIDLGGCWLGVGDQEGSVSIFDLQTIDPLEAAAPFTQTELFKASMMDRSAVKFRAHNDAIGSVNFHPLRPLILSVSGSRHFDPTSSIDRDALESSDSDDSDSSDVRTGPVTRVAGTSLPIPRDATVKLWDFGRGMLPD